MEKRCRGLSGWHDELFTKLFTQRRTVTNQNTKPWRWWIQITSRYYNISQIGPIYLFIFLTILCLVCKINTFKDLVLKTAALLCISWVSFCKNIPQELETSKGTCFSPQRSGSTFSSWEIFLPPEKALLGPTNHNLWGWTCSYVSRSILQNLAWSLDHGGNTGFYFLDKQFQVLLVEIQI